MGVGLKQDRSPRGILDVGKRLRETEIMNLRVVEKNCRRTTSPGGRTLEVSRSLTSGRGAGNRKGPCLLLRDEERVIET